MGFLSKLFGGEASPTSGKAEAPAPAAGSEDAGAAKPAPPEQPPAPAPAPIAAPAPAPIAAPTATPTSTATPKAAAARAAAPAVPGPPSSRRATEADNAVTLPVDVKPNIAASTKSADARGPAAAPAPAPASSVQSKTGPFVRRPALESSIVTSAPALTPPAAAGAAARSNTTGDKPGAAPKPGTAAGERAKMPTLSGEPRAKMPTLSGEPRAKMPTLSGESRAKVDRSKSPGFYSSVSPANGIQAVTGATPSRTNLQKSTVIGLAPIVANVAPAGSGDGVVAPTVEGAPVSSGIVGTAADAAPIVSALAGDDAAPPTAIPAVEEEKEDTSPGLGHTPSRHDPALRLALPEQDLNLLLEFVLDLGLGLASPAWLEPVSAAIGRLRAAAGKLQRTALDKALTQLGTELEGPNALSEERKSRILQQFLLVDLALPGPVDVAGKRLLRERLIVEQLLGELALSNPLLTQRVRDEGVVSLERLARFDAGQLASKLGVPVGDAEQIVSTFQAYLLTRSQRGPELVLLGTARAVEQRLGSLEASARDFDRACDTESTEARRRARRQRQNEVAQLNLLLAECGEADILGELERYSVQGKIDRVKRWLSERPAN